MHRRTHFTTTITTSTATNSHHHAFTSASTVRLDQSATQHLISASVMQPHFLVHSRHHFGCGVQPRRRLPCNGRQWGKSGGVRARHVWCWQSSGVSASSITNTALTNTTTSTLVSTSIAKLIPSDCTHNMRRKGLPWQHASTHYFPVLEPTTSETHTRQRHHITTNILIHVHTLPFALTGIDSSPNFRVTNESLTTSSLLRFPRQSTRSNGCQDERIQSF